MSNNSGTNGSLPFSVSQNFLTSAITIKRLLRLTSITNSDHVIEIGAGKGHITRELAKICRMVDAYEIDSKLYKQLQLNYGDAKNLMLRHQDFLKAALPHNETYKVFSNIPFSITSKIIRKLTCAHNSPQETWLVMEKGAAKRFLGQPRETLASISIKPFFDVSIIYYFSRQDFHPMPSVDAVLLRLARKTPCDIPISQRKSFTAFIENSLRYGPESQLTKKQISIALKLAGLPGIQTSGEILYVQWLCLFRCYCKFHMHMTKPPS